VASATGTLLVSLIDWDAQIDTCQGASQCQASPIDYATVRLPMSIAH
jgi:hypothetical protein